MGIRKDVVRVSCVVIACMVGLVAVSSVALLASSETIEVSTDMPPLILERLAAGVVLGDDGLIYVFGGYRYNYTAWDYTTNTVMIYNISTGKTTFGTSMPNGVAWPSCAKLPDGRIVVIGGYDSAVQNSTSAVRIYTPRTNSWTTNATAPMNISRAGTALGLDGKVYVFGPINSQNSTLIYDPANDTWSYGHQITWSRSRYDSCAVTYNETAIYMIGGFHFEMIWVFPPGVWMPVLYDTNYVDIYNPVTDSWTVGPSLTKNKMAGGAALSRDGFIRYYGGIAYLGAAYDEIERLDVSSPGATWQLSTYTLSKVKSQFGTVADDYGRVFLVGGIDYPTYRGIADVEMILTAEVSEVNEIVISRPTDGAGVNGTTEIIVEAKNQHMAGVVVVDAYVDGGLLESQLGGGATAWTFVWNASGLALNSTHDVLVRAFFSDGSISEDEASYMIVPAPTDEEIEERLSRIEDNLTAVLDAISNLASSIDALKSSTDSLAANVTDIEAELQLIRADILSIQDDLASVQAELDQIQSQLDALANSVAELGSSTESELARLSADVTALVSALDTLQASLLQMQASLDELAQRPELNLDEVMDELGSLMDAVENLNRTLDDVDTSVGKAQGSADNASTYAMVAMALAVLVLVVLAVSMFLLRRKP